MSNDTQDNPTSSLVTQQAILNMDMAPQYATSLSYGGLSQQDKDVLVSGRSISHTTEDELSWQRFGGHLATQPTYSLADNRSLLVTPSTSVGEDVLVMHHGNRTEEFGTDSVNEFSELIRKCTYVDAMKTFLVYKSCTVLQYLRLGLLEFGVTCST